NGDAFSLLAHASAAEARLFAADDVVALASEIVVDPIADPTLAVGRWLPLISIAVDGKPRFHQLTLVTEPGEAGLPVRDRPSLARVVPGVRPPAPALRARPAPEGRAVARQRLRGGNNPPDGVRRAGQSANEGGAGLARIRTAEGSRPLPGDHRGRAEQEFGEGL